MRNILLIVLLVYNTLISAEGGTHHTEINGKYYFPFGSTSVDKNNFYSSEYPDLVKNCEFKKFYNVKKRNEIFCKNKTVSENVSIIFFAKKDGTEINTPVVASINKPVKVKSKVFRIDKNEYNNIVNVFKKDVRFINSKRISYYKKYKELYNYEGDWVKPIKCYDESYKIIYKGSIYFVFCSGIIFGDEEEGFRKDYLVVIFKNNKYNLIAHFEAGELHGFLDVDNDGFFEVENLGGNLEAEQYGFLKIYPYFRFNILSSCSGC